MMARLMLSAGMLFALAVATASRSRGLASMSPPPLRAATVISLINRVKMRPRLASVAAFLCLIECHFECPDMTAPVGKRSLILPPRRAALKDKDESHESRRCDKGSRQN